MHFMDLDKILIIEVFVYIFFLLYGSLPLQGRHGQATGAQVQPSESFLRGRYLLSAKPTKTRYKCFCARNVFQRSDTIGSWAKVLVSAGTQAANPD